MRCPCFRAASYCFLLLLAHSIPTFAVNLEFSAAVPNERLGVSTHAEITSTGGPNVEGIAGLPDASAYTGAVRVDENNPEIVVASSEAIAGLYTNIALDSPAAYVTLMTPGAELPPELAGFGTNQWAKGFSNLSGEAYQAGWTAMSALDTFDKFNPLSVNWVIDVLPSPGETPGRPVLVQIDTIAEGALSAVGLNVANASWQVDVNDLPIFSGSAGVGGTTLPFAASANHDFLVSLGSSFTLRFLWSASASGSYPGSSQAEFTAARIDLSATIVPEPSALLLASIGSFLLATRQRALFGPS